jgi:hypothetical protein
MNDGGGISTGDEALGARRAWATKPIGAYKKFKTSELGSVV